MHNYKELHVWKKSRELVKEIYSETKDFPDSEKYGLRSQIRRSSVSIPSNIAEGSGRTTDKDFANFLSISLSSAFELETQILLACDLGFISEISSQILSKRIVELQKMLFSFRKKLKS